MKVGYKCINCQKDKLPLKPLRQIRKSGYIASKDPCKKYQAKAKTGAKSSGAEDQGWKINR